MSQRKIVIIGGSAAGAKAAARARRLDQSAAITIIQKDPDLSMASCGYPYYIGGAFDNREALLATPTGVVRDPRFFHKTKNINAMVKTECIEIRRGSKEVVCRNLTDGKTFSLHYDVLALCLGAVAKPLPIPGSGLKGVTPLLSMADTDYLHQACAKTVKHCVIVGGGYIGVEACEAMLARGISVTLVEMEERILTMLDDQLARLVENHLKSKGAEIITGTKLETVIGKEDRVTGVMFGDGTTLACDVVITATGVAPNIRLAVDAGLAIGDLGGIEVNEHMQTSDEAIYAAGDCVECTNILTGNKVLAPLGDIANLQGRVMGENMALGNRRTFPGITQTAICKVADFGAGVSGLTEQEAIRQGFTDIETVINASPDKPGFMGAGLLVSKMLIDRSSEKILGYQCVGTGDVSRQLATAAMAVRAGLRLNELISLDLPYAPPYSLAIDHFIATAHIMQNTLEGRLTTVTAEEVYTRYKEGTLPFLLDARGADEFEVLRLGIGEKYIPLGILRDRLDELPQDKTAEIICYCKISLRGYEAALVLKANGWSNVKVLEGGIMAWPYPREL